MDLPAPFFVYILRCSDGSYYVGHTHSLSERVLTHNAGKGAAWTARRLPVECVFHESLPTEAEAIQRENQLKGWSREKKRALIEGNLTQLKALSKRRSR